MTALREQLLKAQELAAKSEKSLEAWLRSVSK